MFVQEWGVFYVKCITPTYYHVLFYYITYRYLLLLCTITSFFKSEAGWRRENIQNLLLVFKNTYPGLLQCL